MNKKIIIALFLVLALGIMAHAVNALTLSEVDLGSDTQDRDQTTTANLMITNNASSQVTVSLTSLLSSNYQTQFSANSVQIPAGGSIPVTVTIYVPKTQIVGKQNLGIITATDNLGNQASTAVFLTTKNELIISKIHADVNGAGKSLSDGDTLKVKPGDDVTLSVTGRNDNTDNVDIQDISLDMKSDTDLDLDTSDDMSDLSSGDKDTVDETFTIPTDLDTGDYDVDFTLTGRDENGVRFEDKQSITIRVERESHEIMIENLQVSPTDISCGGKATVRMTLHNTGSHDETQVALLVKNSDLKLDQYTTKMSINMDDTVDKFYTFDVPSNTPAGEYIIEAATYYTGDIQSDDQVVSLIVDPCQTTTNTNNTTTTTTTTTVTPPPVVIPQGNVVGPSYGASSFWNSDAYLIVLVAAVAIILLLIIVLLIKFVF